MKAIDKIPQIMASGAFGVVTSPPLFGHTSSKYVAKISDRLVLLRELYGAHCVGKIDRKRRYTIKPVDHGAVPDYCYQPIKQKIESRVDIDIVDPYQIVYPKLGYSVRQLLDLNLFDQKTWQAYRQTILGLLELNYNQVLHIDFKPDNVIIGWPNKPNEYQGRIIDYGLVTYMDHLAPELTDSLQQLIPDFTWHDSCYSYWSPEMYTIQPKLKQDQLYGIVDEYLALHPMTNWMEWNSLDLTEYLCQLATQPLTERLTHIAQSWDLYSLGVSLYEIAVNVGNDRLLYSAQQLVDFNTPLVDKLTTAHSLCYSKIEID